MSETLPQTESSGYPMATSPSTSPSQTSRVASTQTTSPPRPQKTVVPITALSPYQNRWMICARVTAKPPIHTYHNKLGRGRVLNMQLCDESGRIQAVAFNDVADKLDSVFEAEKIYYISRGRIQLSKKAFSSLSKYELLLSAETEAELCPNIPWNIPQTSYDFINIGEIEKLEANAIIDVIGVCCWVGELKTVVKGADKVVLRDIHLLDQSEATIACTLWHSEAEAFDGTDSPVVALKGCKVSNFGGRSLSCVSSTQVSVKPNIPQARELQSWFSRRTEAETFDDTDSPVVVVRGCKVSRFGERNLSGVSCTQVSMKPSTPRARELQSWFSRRIHGIPIQASSQPPYLSLGQVRELEQAGVPEGRIAFCTKATILYARSKNCVYKACPSADCNKKVTEGGEGGQYHCEKCNQTYPDFKYRMILALEVADYSTTRWLTCFETASSVLGMGATELAALQDEDKDAYDGVFSRLHLQEYMFTVRANCKVDSFAGDSHLKCICTMVTPIHYARETRYRIGEIKELLGSDMSL